MDNYFKYDEWKIIEDGFDPEKNQITESIMSLGNGHMGLRGNFEEGYSGESLQGTYIAGVYYPDKTRVGWWKIGYPEYYAKVLNATNFIGINVKINGKKLDLAKMDVEQFKRILNIKKGYLDREFVIKDFQGRKTKVKARRFLSSVDREIAVVTYSLKPLNHNAKIELAPFLDGAITNEDANYDEVFWDEIEKNIDEYKGYLNMKTKKSNFQVSTAMKYELNKNPDKIETFQKEKYVENKVSLMINKNEELT